MPGLFGMFSPKPQAWCRNRIDTMLAAATHEPFYSKGTYADEQVGAYIAWTCHEGSPNDCMPLFNENKDIVSFVAGEITPDVDSVKALSKRGHDFIEGNLSFLPHLYEEQGDDFIGAINGTFAYVLIDRRKMKVCLFNDRFGIHRIFYYRGKDSFYFASEAKAILAVIPETRSFDAVGLAEYVSLGCTIGENSIFNDVKILPGGSLLEFNHGRLISSRTFFKPVEWERQDKLPPEQFIPAFSEQFHKTVQKFTSWWGPMGISLTGGLDSRMIMACIDFERYEMPCYTFGSKYRDTFDVKVSRKVAAACNQKHGTIVLGDEFLKRFEDYLHNSVSISDGYIGLPGAAELYVNRQARKRSKLRFTGNWGSELLRGVRAFKFAPPANEFLTSEFNQLIGEVQQRFDSFTHSNPLSFTAFFQAPHQSFGRAAVERSQVTPITPFLDNDLLALLNRRPRDINGFDIIYSILQSYCPKLMDISTDRGYIGSRSVTVRQLNRVTRELLFKSEYIMGTGVPERFLPVIRLFKTCSIDNLFSGWHKFYHFRKWSQNELVYFFTAYLEKLNYPLLKDYFNLSHLKLSLNNHIKRKNNCVSVLDTVVTLNAYANTFFNPNFF